jgi:hypothetical protein
MEAVEKQKNSVIGDIHERYKDAIWALIDPSAFSALSRDLVDGIDLRKRNLSQEIDQKLDSLTVMQSLTIDENLENYILFEAFFSDADLDSLDGFFNDYKPSNSPVSEETMNKFKMQIRAVLSMLVLYSRYYKESRLRPLILRNLLTNDSYIGLVDDIRSGFMGYPDYPGESQPVLSLSVKIKNAFEKFFTINNEKIRKKILDDLFNGTLMIEVYNNLLKEKLKKSGNPILTDQEISENVTYLVDNANMFLLPFLQIFKEPFTMQTVDVRQSLEDVCTSLGKTYNVMDLSDPPLLFPRVLPEDSVYRGGLKKYKNRRNSKKNNRKYNKKPKKTYKKSQNTHKRRTIKKYRPLPKKNKTIRNHSKTI